MSQIPFQSSGEEVPFAIPNHRLFRRIGRGSYGEVWLATDFMNQWRAVKIVSLPEDGRGDHGYKREFQAITRYERISHSDGLMPILTVGGDPDDNPVGKYFFYTMELADNATQNSRLETEDLAPGEAGVLIHGYKPRTLRSELRHRGRLSPAECVEIGIPLALALEQLHEHGLIHRDIKPDNIIFVHGRPKLADVGLVADVDATYSLAGTTAYLAPEAVRKEAADIFALGKVLYEIATGRDADEFPNPPKDLGAFSDQDQKAWNELNAVILKACANETRERHASAAELREELEMLRKNRSVIRLRELEERDRRRRRIVRRWALTSGILAGLLLFTFLAFYGLNSRNHAAEEGRQRELREIRISRSIQRQDGWSTVNWSRLEQVAHVKMDQNVVEHATSLMTGLDAINLSVYRNVSAGSAAFGLDGRAFLGGIAGSHAMLIDTNGVRTELPVVGEGPVCWTPDDVPLQLVAVSNVLLLREGQTGKVRKQFSIPGGIESSPAGGPVLALTPTGARVAAGLRDRVIVWDAATGEELGETGVETAALAFSPDGSQLAAGGLDGVTRVYGIPHLFDPAVLPPALRGSPILCLAFGRNPIVGYATDARTNSWLLAVGDQGANIVIWDLKRKLPLSYCRGSPWNVQSVAFHPDGLTLASGGRNEPRLWDVMSGQVLLRLGGVDGTVSTGGSRALAFDRAGRRMVFGGEPEGGYASVAIWSIQRHRGIDVLRGLASAARKVWFSADSRLVAALSDDWHLALWDTTNGHLLFLIETPIGHSADHAGGCFDATDSHFAFVAGTEARLYELATAKVVQSWRLKDGLSDQLHYDSKGRLLMLRRERASAERNSVWRLYTLTGSSNADLLYEQKETNWTAMHMAFRAGGGQFLVWNGGQDTNRIVRVYDTASGRELWNFLASLPNDRELRVVLDPTGRRLGYNAYENGTRGPRMWLRDLSTGREIGSVRGHYEAVGPTGTQFAADGLLYPDLTSLNRVIPLASDWKANKNVCAFSPDGKLLAYGTEEGAVLVADLNELRHRLDSLGKRK